MHHNGIHTAVTDGVPGCDIHTVLVCGVPDDVRMVPVCGNRTVLVYGVLVCGSRTVPVCGVPEYGSRMVPVCAAQERGIHKAPARRTGGQFSALVQDGSYYYR